MINLLAGLLQGAKRIRTSQALVLLALAVLAVLGGAIAYALTEHVGIGIALYWAVTTATTVGYGDVTPHNAAGRVVAVVEMVTAIPLFGGVFASVTALATSTKLRKMLRLDEHHPPDEPFVALYGDDSVLPTVARRLADTGAKVLLVGQPPTGSELVDGSVRTIPEDPTFESVVRRSAPERASQALVSSTDESATLVTVVHLRHLAPDLAVTALVKSTPIAQALRDLGIATVISLEELVGSLLAKSLEAPHAGALLTSLVGSERYLLAEMDLPKEYEGDRLSTVRSVPGSVVLAAVHAGEVTYGVADDPQLAPGDRLLVLREEKARPGAASLAKGR